MLLAVQGNEALLRQFNKIQAFSLFPIHEIGHRLVFLIIAYVLFRTEELRDIW